MLINTSYNPDKSMQAKLFEDLAANKDNSSSIASSITTMGDFNIN